MNWQEERDAKRRERDIKRHMRAMATPISRGESLNVMVGMEGHLTSVALAIEALDNLLVEKGILADNEILDKMKVLAETKRSQMEAEAATEEPPRIITPV